MSAGAAGLAGTSRTRLRLVMLAFFLALAVPGAVLVFHAYGQLKWEAFHQYRELAEDLSRRIDERFSRLLAAEDAREFADYRFLASEDGGGVVQRSALSRFPVRSEIPGLVGWFQVDPAGALSTPLLPDAPGSAIRFGLSARDVSARAALEQRIQSILGANRLVGGRAPRTAGRGDAAPAPAAQAPATLSSVTASDAPRVATSGAAARAPLGGIATPPAERLADRHAPASRPLADTDAAAEAERPAAPGVTRSLPAAEESADDASGAPPRPAAIALAEPAPQAAFDELKSAKKQSLRRRQAPPGPLEDAEQSALERPLKRIEELNLSSPYDDAAAAHAKDEQRASRDAEQQRRAARKEAAAGVLREAARADAAREAQPAAAKARPAPRGATRIRTFESELDPFEVSLLDSGHFVLYRKVWRDGQRYIQGALIEQRPLLAGLVETAFDGTALSRTGNLLVAWQGDVLAEFSGNPYRALLDSNVDLAGALLHRARLSAPLADLELVFSVSRLPVGPGATVVAWTASALALVLVAGVWLMYRLGIRQIALARQQQDFVSAVSHELRTPITSIRMYAEMLREGWASEEKKRGYYTFIVQESERLSRLIANVLQLARMTRNEFSVQLEDRQVATLLDGVRSQVASQVEHAGFELAMECAGEAAQATVRVDPDAFSQCIINLVDNALKFSATAECRRVEVGCHLDGDGRVNVTVRDHGPGIARDQMKKIFTLFYRSESELTRETVGTGIGLALVHQLVRAMHGQVDVANADPGARFTLRFPALAARESGRGAAA